MKIIKINPNENRAHDNQETSRITVPPTGWAVIPEDMSIPDTFPFVNIVVDETADPPVVTEMTAGVMPEPPVEPDPPAPSGNLDERVAALEQDVNAITAAVEKGLAL